MKELLVVAAVAAIVLPLAYRSWKKKAKKVPPTNQTGSSPTPNPKNIHI